MLKLFYFRWNLVISDLAVEDKNSCYFCFRRILKVFIRVFWALSYLFILLVRAFLPCYRYSTLAPQCREDLHQLWALSDCYFFLLSCLLFLALLLLYHDCCRFERVFLTLRFFLLYNPSLHLVHVPIQHVPIEFIKVFLGAESSSLKAAWHSFVVRNTNPASLFVWVSQCSPKAITR